MAMAMAAMAMGVDTALKTEPCAAITDSRAARTGGCVIRTSGGDYYEGSMDRAFDVPPDILPIAG